MYLFLCIVQPYMWESVSCSVARCNQTTIFQHHETKEAISSKVKRRICFVRRGCLSVHIALNFFSFFLVIS